jgi:hypothetical protein
VAARIPYWYGVASNKPAHITVLYLPTAPPAANVEIEDAIWFRVTDSSGIIDGTVTPVVLVTSGGGSVQSVDSLNSYFPGVWGVNLRLGPTSGASNVFTIVAGALTQTVTIVSQ